MSDKKVINLQLIAEEQLDPFVEELLKKANLASLPPTYKKEYKRRLIYEIQRRVGIVILNELKEEDLKELETLFEGNPKVEEIVAFLSSRLANLKEIIKRSLNEFAEEFITAAKNIKR